MMKFNLELSGEQVQMIRIALMRQSNQAYQAGESVKSMKLDLVEAEILNQIDLQRIFKETV